MKLIAKKDTEIMGYYRTKEGSEMRIHMDLVEKGKTIEIHMKDFRVVVDENIGIQAEIDKLKEDIKYYENEYGFEDYIEPAKRNYPNYAIQNPEKKTTQI